MYYTLAVFLHLLLVIAGDEANANIIANMPSSLRQFYDDVLAHALTDYRSRRADYEGPRSRPRSYLGMCHSGCIRSMATDRTS
ncbi:hypothetical protein F4775DRAFT_597155 [Biscogniauxia sp. FL1348]|nr:hypothetical protein F4775DRAFT_597155 [Biscogniauxia sp. FL1348]